MLLPIRSPRLGFVNLRPSTRWSYQAQPSPPALDPLRQICDSGHQQTAEEECAKFGQHHVYRRRWRLQGSNDM